MTLIEMIALVAAVTEFIKGKLAKWIQRVFPRFEIKGKIAVILTAVVTLGVVAYDVIQSGRKFSVVAFISLAVQVFMGSNIGYQLLKVPKAKTT